MREKSATHAEIVRIAAKQHGVISTRQLLTAGLSNEGVRRRRTVGHLHRIHRGVYAVGHPALSHEGTWMAAVLAHPGSVVSHRSAASLWGLLPPGSEQVDVTIRGDSGRRRRRGIRLHRSKTLAHRDITRRNGIPVTTPARTCADLRRVVSEQDLRRAVRQAAVLGLSLGAEVAHDGTRSDLERRFLWLCRSHGIPAPQVNARIGGLEVDFLWRNRRLVVETDGYRYHRGRAAFEHDRGRDLRLRALGYDVVRLTHRQLTEQPKRVALTVATLLATPPRS